MRTASAQIILNAFDETSRSILIADATLPDTPITYVNAAFSALSGYTSAEAIGRNCRFLQGVGTNALVREEIRAAIVGGYGIQREILNYRKDGSTFWNDLTIDPVHDALGRVTAFIGVQYEAGEARRAKEANAEAESRLANIASHIPGYVYQRVMRTDGSIEVVYHSPSLNRLLGLDPSQAPCKFYDYVHPDDRESLFEAIQNSAANMSIFREEFRLVSLNGASHWLRSDAPPRLMENGEIVWDGLALEIGAEKRWESEIADQALRDSLTGLFTRAAWWQALDVQLQGAGCHTRQCGVLHLDIDGFGELNDSLGQTACDEILRQIAQRLGKLAQAVQGVGGRLGGDEFGVLIPACADSEHLSMLARSAVEALAEPMQVGEQQLVVHACVGTALHQDAPYDGLAAKDPASELMTQAELALRWAKQLGAGSQLLYSRERDDRFQNQSVLARSFPTAILNDELELHYQPLVDLASGRIVSAEALVRWHHPTLGMQRPDLFIAIAEKQGLIGQLGLWVIDQAMKQRTLWEDAGLAPPPIAINVSGMQLIEPGFVASVEELLKSRKVSARHFELELTEGLLIEPSPQVLASLHALRDLGFMITIDDFGSGHATFRYLRDFPIDKLKIDQIFVRKLVLGSTDALIIRAVMSLAQNMGIAFVAEGIETEMQRDFLHREGCCIGQGYYFSMPLVAEDFAWTLANSIHLPVRPLGDLASEDESERDPAHLEEPV
jgi:diguanylate cyclase (GGDEF)-like protein/PAS domain S-box-containing protein